MGYITNKNDDMVIITKHQWEITGPILSQNGAQFYQFLPRFWKYCISDITFDDMLFELCS